MSAEYIKIHKPISLQQVNITETPKLKSKRKSTAANSAKKSAKKPQVAATEPNVDILQHIFSSFEEKIIQTKEQIHHDLFESIFFNTVEYFTFYANKRAAFSQNSLSQQIQFNPICNVIPTIALHTGINTQDYSSLCDSLTSRLKLETTPNLFFINEKNSNNIKTLVNSIFVQSEDKTTKMNNFTFRHLFESIRSQKVIFVFKQFELIPKETIESFVSLISCHVEHVSIYFIIELASQSNIINEQLSSSVIAKLCIKKLYLMSPEHYIDRFLNKLFIEQNCSFKLSGEILQFLMETYDDYNFSISGFIHALKFCFYEHLNANSLNGVFLSSHVDDGDYYDRIFEKLVEKSQDNQNVLETICLETNEPDPKLCIQKVQSQYQKHHNQFILICHFLYEIVKHFPSEDSDLSLFSSSTKYFSDLYVKMCNFSSESQSSKTFTQSEQYSNLRKLLSLSSHNTIHEIACSFSKLIQSRALNNQANYSTDFLNELHTFSEILEKLKQTFAVQPERNCLNDDDLNDLPLSMLAKKSQTKVTRRTSMKQPLKPISENSPAKKRFSMMPPPEDSSPTPGEKQQAKKALKAKQTQQLKQTMLEWLTCQFSIYFEQDYAALPGSNSSFFCFNDLKLLKERLYGVQRINMHDCLIQSFNYLNLSRFVSEKKKDSPRKRLKSGSRRSSPVLDEESEMSQTLLPINIIYKLYLECGHMINLYDWLQAFVERMENADIKELSESKRKTLLALFFRTITELQFMGYIKATTRKVDHVIKLTNGSNLLALQC